MSLIENSGATFRSRAMLKTLIEDQSADFPAPLHNKSTSHHTIAADKTIGPKI